MPESGWNNSSKQQMACKNRGTTSQYQAHQVGLVRCMSHKTALGHTADLQACQQPWRVGNSCYDETVSSWTHCSKAIFALSDYVFKQARQT
jgi:hypothetical protein